MGVPNQQIGWSDKAKLLQRISKQLKRLTEVLANSGSVTTSSTTTTP